MIDYKQIADSLINNYCDTFGVNNCIAYLLDIGCTEDELLEMGFDREDIEDEE